MRLSVLNIEPASFTLRDETPSDHGPVVNGDDPAEAIDLMALIMVLIQTVKDQAQRIDALEWRAT